MNDFASREFSNWGFLSSEHEKSYFHDFDVRERDLATPRPSKSYSKRSSHIQDLRSRYKWASENSDIDLMPPSKAALSSAESVINNLPEGCLDFDLAISHSGEVNFFFGQKEQPFQILIDDTGGVSFYGLVEGEEVEGSDKSPADLPYLKLLTFVDRNK
jgi:hypothetical protein